MPSRFDVHFQWRIQLVRAFHHRFDQRTDAPDLCIRHFQHQFVVHLQDHPAAQRMAVNHPIQGTAADIIKIAMIHLHDELQRQGLESKMILQVHDELVLEAPDPEVERVSALVENVMEGAYKLDAPLKVDIKTGRHWGEME